MALFVQGIPGKILKAWSAIPAGNTDTPLSEGYIHLSDLSALISAALRYRHADGDTLASLGQSHADWKRKQRALQAVEERRLTKGFLQKNTAFYDTRNFQRRAASPDTVRRMQREVAEAESVMKAWERAAAVQPWSNRPPPLAGARIVSSTSSKLNYIVNEVCWHLP